MEGKRREIWMREIRLVLLTVVFGMLAMGALVMIKVGTARETQDVQEISEGWYYMEDGQKIEVSLPCEIPAADGETLTLYNETLTKECAGKTITTRGAQYDLRIIINNETLYTYSEGYLFPRNDQMKSKLDCDGEIPLDYSVGKLALVYQTADGGKYQLSRVYIGSGAAVEAYHYNSVAFTLIASLVLLVLAVISAGISIYLNYREIPDSRFTNVAFFFATCSIWSLTDSSLVQTGSSYPEAICLVSFYAFMLLAVPMIRFIKKIGNMERYWLLDILICCFYANAAIQGFLAYMEIFSFVQMLFVTHILLFVSVIICIVLLSLEYRRNPDRETKLLLIAFATVGTAGILALLLYWLLKISYYGAIFEVGILIFMVLVLADAVIKAVESLRYRTEFKIYQKLQREDWMTGMENRRPFEDALSEVQGTAREWEDIYLIFLDIDHLRKINEEFGRAVGDGLIIGAARCIANVYGEEGKCYRIGDDEFGVLVYNPKETIEEYFRRLDEEIAAFNRQSRNKLSITRGASSIRDRDGRLKPVSDWKYEADLCLFDSREREVDGNV